MKTDYQGKRILITGATGLIGKSLVEKAVNLGMEVLAVTRNAAKAQVILSYPDRVELIESDIAAIPIYNMNIDYIIHGAAITESKAFVERPTDVINKGYEGTLRVLELAKANNVEGLVYLSSMEVYGVQKEDERIPEDHFSALDTMSVRSCYPESKRLCESLCSAYASQYGIPAKVVRLTQTFGPGANYDDKRVFAEFARCVIENRDIVLHTKGETKRMYLFTEDAADAIFEVLFKGAPGEAYNAANENTYCSIYEMAVLVAKSCANNNIKVVIEEDHKNYGYAPTLTMNLDTLKLRKLGWEPKVDLETMFDLMIEDMRKNVIRK